MAHLSPWLDIWQGKNMGKDPPPLDMDMPNDSFIELPDDYEVVPYVEDTVGDIFLQPT